MDKVNEDIPKPTENIVDLSQIKSPKIKSFIQQQLPNLEWIQHKEQAHEGLPSISFNFYFSSHGSIEDVRGREKAIFEADIYVSEMRGWNQFTRDVYDSVSIGEIKPEDALKEIDYPKDDSYYVHLQELKYLYGKRIPVLFVDINQEQLSSLGPIREKPLHDTFAETLPDFKHWLMEDSEYLIAREVLMLAQLNEQIKSVLDLNPDLKSKPNLNISLTLGTAHTWLYHTLYNHGFTTNREFRNNLPIMDLRSEAFRTIE